MSITKANIASRVLRNLQIPENTDASSVQALADVKQYIDERARKVWAGRHWPEYVILGTYTIPANTFTMTLANIIVDSGFTSGSGFNASFYDVAAIRQGSSPLLPEDMGAINMVQADAWAQNGPPIRFVNKGKSGIHLLGNFVAATTLSFFGKADFQTMSDTETWILDHEDCLIAGATADMLKYHERDYERSAQEEQNFMNEIGKMIHIREAQGANIKRFIPIAPWTGYDYNQNNDINTSVTGAPTYI